MLPWAEFICLRFAYREAFWEELSTLVWRGRSIRRPLLLWVHVIFFYSLPSQVGCTFQGNLFSIFKLLCLVFVRYYLSSRTALENCVLFVIEWRSPWENFFADARFVLLTYPGSASVQCGLHGRTEYPLSRALAFFTQTSVSYWTLLLVIFHNEYKFIYVPRWISVEKKKKKSYVIFYKLCAKIYLFRSSQRVLALIFRCE